MVCAVAPIRTSLLTGSGVYKFSLHRGGTFVGSLHSPVFGRHGVVDVNSFYQIQSEIHKHPNLHSPPMESNLIRQITNYNGDLRTCDFELSPVIITDFIYM